MRSYVDAATHARLQRLAARMKRTKGEVIEAAVDTLVALLPPDARHQLAAIIRSQRPAAARVKCGRPGRQPSGWQKRSGCTPGEVIGLALLVLEAQLPPEARRRTRGAATSGRTNPSTRRRRP